MIKDRSLIEWYWGLRDRRRNTLARILEVDYAHLTLENGDDLYLTRYGLPFAGLLRPENFWLDQEWFRANSLRLEGTSAVYRVRTKPVDGRGKEIILKWNRMGQEVPGEGLSGADFNSPFEEFSLVMELRDALYASSGRVALQKPLAVYVPAERVELWQSGRSEDKMRRKLRSHAGAPLDMYRSYAVVYEWIDGLDADQASRRGLLDPEAARRLSEAMDRELAARGFRVADSKPQHVILRPRGGGELARDRDGEALRALVDYELLEPTPEREAAVKRERRAAYLQRQKDRFAVNAPVKFHPHLSHVNILGVDYIYGKVESTGGRLWVVGKDPYLFDYFLPEKWEQSPKTLLSPSGHLHQIVTADNVRLVCEISQVGIRPDLDPYRANEKRMWEHGCNSPFEQVYYARRAEQGGLGAVYPRAVYMTGRAAEIPPHLFDGRRYETHQHYRTPGGGPVLEKGREYLIFWGFWNGPDEKLAVKDGDYYQGIDALLAWRQRLITEPEYFLVMREAEERLARAGLRDLNLTGDHILLSLDADRKVLIRDEHGRPEARLRNFQFFQDIPKEAR